LGRLASENEFGLWLPAGAWSQTISTNSQYFMISSQGMLMGTLVGRRRLGKTDLEVSPVALGCWPISGMTSIDVNDRDSLETLSACRDVGINFLDTAYCYGAQGESERLIARALGNHRDDFVIATKGGVHWNPDGQRGVDGRPATLKRECEESLQRLATDRVDLLYLHAPDPQVPVSDSAGALRELLDEGKSRAIGVSNFSVAQLVEFHDVCPITAHQPPFNMLQRGIETDTLPWCIEHNVSTVVYWPLMKGLLAGKLSREHVFAAGDGRAKYPMFQGDEWQKNQDLVDELRRIATASGRTVAQVVVNWTIHREGISVALCGAKRAAQIEETSVAMRFVLSDEDNQAIDAALQRRGTAITRPAI
jgi:aryl-alcohol dehydrogenase-like predicted oxidoreductase